MADFDFHFVPAPTGEISGESVLQQTEDGINAVGKIAQSSDDKSAEALLIANQANATADNAQSAATNAAAEAEAAVEKVNTLQKVVTGYDDKITAAVSAAEGAVTTANGAASSASAAQASAKASETAAQGAEANAAAAVTQAQTAAASAADAISQAQTAAASAATAQAAAETAKNTAQEAQTAAADSASTAASALANAYALRVTTSTLTDGGTVDTTALTPEKGIKTGDIIIDAVGNIFEITSIEDGVAEVEKVVTPFVQAISYAAAQSLTETQQRQALSNAGLFAFYESVITTNGGEVPA